MPRQAFQPEGMAKPKPPHSLVVVSGDTPCPARSSAEAGLPPGVLVEIEAVARRA
jgi:enamine deaminase RidA (YjgF/YER057c/UK114 family)